MVIWKIVTELVEINDLQKFQCKQFVEHYYHVLSGEKSASFIFAIRIPQKFVVNNLVGIKWILKKYLENRCLTKEEILELKSVSQREEDKPVTLNEIFEGQISKLLKLGFEFYDNKMEFGLKSVVYIEDDTTENIEKELLDKLIALLEGYEGEKSFYVITNFDNGVGSVSIQV